MLYPFTCLARMLIRSFNKAGQTLNYTEVRQGLASLSTPVHMSNREFADVMHVVDPDQSGDLSVAEWEAFMLVRASATQSSRVKRMAGCPPLPSQLIVATAETPSSSGCLTGSGCAYLYGLQLSDAELEAKQIELNSQADPTAKLRKRLAYIPVLGQVAGTMDVGVKESGVDDEARALDSE
jgi:hypothetical protein|eukprot:COSAG06_NODE_4556_length_4151_cov_1.692744_5_plen_181_part_00